MEFGKHIGKGIWAFADKSLAVIYGLGFIFLVIRILPEDEYGAFVILQAIFMLIISIGTSFALQPLIKFASEKDDYSSILTTSSLLYIIFLSFSTLILLILKEPIANLLDSSRVEKITSVLNYLPLLLLSSFVKSVLTALLQTRFYIKKIFWIDSVYFIGSLILFYIARMLNYLNTVEDLILIAIITNSLSSVLAIILSRNLIKLNKNIDINSLKKIWSLGKFSLSSSISYSVYLQLDTFIVTVYTGVVGAALYGAVKILTRIFDIYSQVIQMLVFPASSILQGRKETDKLPELIEKSICFSFFSILPIVILFGFFNEPIIHLFYSNQYGNGSALLKIFSLVGFFIPWGAVISSVLFGIGKTNVLFILSLINLILTFLIYTIMGHLAGIQGIVWGIVIIQFIMITIGVMSLKKYIPFTLLSTFYRTKDITSYILKNLKEIF